MDTRKVDPACERLGDLAASAMPDDGRVPDGGQWARISRHLDRRERWQPLRRLLPALALSAVVLVALGSYFVARRPLGYRIETCSQIGESAVCASVAGAITFTDGTRIELNAGTRMHVRPQPYARGAELLLDDGSAQLAVVHRKGARWAVIGGPFRAEVTGTRFTVRWSKSLRTLDVSVTEGEVRVSGGTLAETAVLHPGQSVHADLVAKLPQAVAAPAPKGRGAAAAERTPDGESDRAMAARPTAALHGSRHRPEASVDSSSTRSHPDVRGAARRPGRMASAPPTLPPMDEDVRPGPAAESSWARARSVGLPPPAPARPAAAAPNQVLFSADGHLAGAMTGRVWLARGSGTRLTTPVSEDEFVTLVRASDGFCASGTVAGLHCVNENVPQVRCNWDRNWGVTVGFDVKAGHEKWGEDAARGIAVEFHGRSASYRLNAHRKGDPFEKSFCVENYRSGQLVTPSMFKTRCWDDQGESLSDFKDVDLFNLQFTARMEYVAFHYCISGIRIER